MSKGALSGLRIVEMAGLGPTPFAAMWLADMGAEIIRIQRPNLKPLMPMKQDVLNRGRGFVELDLKQKQDRGQAKNLIDRADVLIEGMRPGVMERLGLGPEAFQTSNPKLIYGRMTGWGQTGPLAHSAGHDINYIAITGALHAIGNANPVPPLNLVGDFGGGAMYLVAGILAALYAAQASGRGQVVDCAISDGTAHLMSMIYGMYGSKIWADEREANLLDGGAPFYTTYECACGGYMSVGALEPQFYAELLQRMKLDPKTLPNRDHPSNWPELRTIFAQCFLSETRDAWAEIMEGSDACAMPVLSMAEAPKHPHNQARAAFVEFDGLAQSDAAPILSRTPGHAKRGDDQQALGMQQVLERWA